MDDFKTDCRKKLLLKPTSPENQIGQFNLKFMFASDFPIQHRAFCTVFMKCNYRIGDIYS